uniref:hypothetical protein n=1 Tax=Alistipes shahii TaxID=328814 RepID=UPI003FF0DAD5
FNTTLTVWPSAKARKRLLLAEFVTSCKTTDCIITLHQQTQGMGRSEQDTPPAEFTLKKQPV